MCMFQPLSSSGIGPVAFGHLGRLALLPLVCRPATFEFRVQGSGFRVQGSGLRVQGSGFRVQGSGFRVQGSGFGM